MAPNNPLRTYSRGNTSNLSRVNPLDLLFAKNLTEKKLSKNPKGVRKKKKKIEIEELPRRIQSVLADDSSSRSSLHVRFDDTFDKLKRKLCNVPKFYKSRKNNPAVQKFTHYHSPTFKNTMFHPRYHTSSVEISEIKSASNSNKNESCSWFKQTTLDPIDISLEIENINKNPSETNKCYRKSPVLPRSRERLWEDVEKNKDISRQEKLSVNCIHGEKETPFLRKPSCSSIRNPPNILSNDDLATDSIQETSFRRKNSRKFKTPDLPSSDSVNQNRIGTENINQTYRSFFTQSLHEKLTVHSSTPLKPNIRRNIIQQPLSPIATNGLMEKSDSLSRNELVKNAIAESIREIKDWDSTFPKIENKMDVSYHSNLDDFAGATVQERLINMGKFLEQKRQNLLNTPHKAKSKQKKRKEFWKQLSPDHSNLDDFSGATVQERLINMGKFLEQKRQNSPHKAKSKQKKRKEFWKQLSLSKSYSLQQFEEFHSLLTASSSAKKSISHKDFETFHKQLNNFVTRRKKQSSLKKNKNSLCSRFSIRSLYIKLDDIGNSKKESTRKSIIRNFTARQPVINLTRLSLDNLVNSHAQFENSKQPTSQSTSKHSNSNGNDMHHSLEEDKHCWVENSTTIDSGGLEIESIDLTIDDSDEEDIMFESSHSEDPEKTKSDLEELFGLLDANTQKKSTVSNIPGSLDKNPSENDSFRYSSLSVLIDKENFNEFIKKDSHVNFVTERKHRERNIVRSLSVLIDTENLSGIDHVAEITLRDLAELSCDKSQEKFQKTKRYNLRSENTSDSEHYKNLVVNVPELVLSNFTKELVVNISVRADIAAESRQGSAMQKKNQDFCSNDAKEVIDLENSSSNDESPQQTKISKDLVIDRAATNLIPSHILSDAENSLKNFQEANDSTDIVESPLNSTETLFKMPSTMNERSKMRVTLKAGKSWRRSLLTYRRESCLNLTEDTIADPESPFLQTLNSPPRLSHRRISMKIVPERSNVTSRKTSVLQNYALHTVLDESKNDDSLRSVYSVTRKSVAKAISAKDIVLKRCRQTEILPFTKCYPTSLLRNCKKIGEGVYGEVFLYTNSKGESTVMKVIPIEGDRVINGERQKKFGEILSEIVILSELSELRSFPVSNTAAFCKVERICCVKGAYPDKLIDLWDQYDSDKGSENDSPEVFTKDQLYIVLDLANAGQDLEGFVFNNAVQACAMFQQVACALACAEERLQFEHRDLHWGNVLLKSVDKTKIVSCTLKNKKISIQSKGVEATIIDFTLSRICTDGVVLYNDLSQDPELFLGTGDYQFDVYRNMQTRNGNDWQKFEPYSNILWLHYVLDKSIKGLRYKNTASKIHTLHIEKLKDIEKNILQYKSVSDFVSSHYC